MAQAEEGLSDLDDIDALLEEAEQALEEAEPEVLTDAEAEPGDASASAEQAEEVPEAQTEQAPAETAAAEPAEAAEAPDTEMASEPAPAPQEEALVEAEIPPEQPQPTPAQAVEEDEPPIPEHHKSQGTPPKKSGNELTAADMDKLKKLILAFGISTIVLVIIGLGLTIWAAIAASTTHLDEETMTLLEEVKTGVEHVAVKSERHDKTLEAIEKKIDALSFQLEQINGDIGKLEELMNAAPVTPAGAQAHSTPAAHQPAPAHGTTHGGGHDTQSHAQPAPAAPVVATMDPDMKKMLGSINSRLVRTQKKVEKVYTTLRKLQTQYRVMLVNLKKMRSALKAQQQQAQKAAKKKPLKNQYYQYEAQPYDPASIGAYP